MCANLSAMMSRAERTVNLIGVVVPFVGLIAAVVLLWNQWVDWIDLTIMAVTYVLFGLGVTVGYHRLLTHNAFKTHAFTRNALALLAACYGGSPLLWVGVHRVHHAVTDWQADPHTPKRGFWFAHCGWFIESTNPARCALFALSGFGLQVRFFYWDILRLLGRRDNPVAR